MISEVCMHQIILVQRKAKALTRIITAAGSLADQHQLNPARREALEPKGIKDPAALEMMRLEGLADLLEDLAAVDVETVTAVTAEQTQPVEDTRPTLDDFPAHVIEPSEPTKKPTRRSTAKPPKK